MQAMSSLAGNTSSSSYIKAVKEENEKDEEGRRRLRSEMKSNSALVKPGSYISSSFHTRSMSRVDYTHASRSLGTMCGPLLDDTVR